MMKALGWGVLLNHNFCNFLRRFFTFFSTGARVIYRLKNILIAFENTIRLSADRIRLSADALIAFKEMKIKEGFMNRNNAPPEYIFLLSRCHVVTLSRCHVVTLSHLTHKVLKIFALQV